MTSTPEGLPNCEPACQPACTYGAVHRLVCFPCGLGASISHPTARDTRPDPSHHRLAFPVLQARACGPGRRPAVAPPSDDYLVLVLGWSHTSNGSLNYYLVFRNTTACFRSLRPGPFAKGDPANPGTGSNILSTCSQPGNPAETRDLFFETAAVGWLTMWTVPSCFCLSGGLKLVGG